MLNSAPVAAPKLIAPKNGAVLSTSLVRVAVDPDINETAVQKVVFYASYYRALTMLEKQRQPENLTQTVIGEKRRPPYEVLWDVTDVPDQDQYRLSFGFDILYKDGSSFKRKIRYGTEKIHFCVLDRSPTFKEIALQSDWASRPPRIDGKLDEWKNRDSLLFHNNDNRIVIFSKWDKTYLYFGAKVKDEKIVCLEHKYFSVNKRGEKFLRSYFWDAVELCFDFDHNQSPFKDAYDAEIFISPDSSLMGRKDYVVDGGTIEPFTQGIQHAVFPAKTGYTLEVALPWKLANIKPTKNRIIGFDAINFDRDDTTGFALFSSWSGSQHFNNDNPSEWGNLVLSGPPKKNRVALTIIIVATILGLLGWMALQWKRKKAQVRDQVNQVISLKQKGQDRSRPILEYINKNITDEKLNLKMVADHFNMNYTYFSTLFKALIGKPFPDYVNHERTKQAARLLETTDISITQIALDLGFKNTSYFNKIFKQGYGMTASEYREKRN
jgi:AraC-like DNA-binding protein